MHPITLGPDNRYGRAGERGDEGLTGHEQLLRVVLRGSKGDGGAQLVRIAPYHAGSKEGAQFVRNAPHHDGCK